MIDYQQLNNAMSDGYWQRWNPQVQSQIDADIERNRKADGAFVTAAPAGAEVKVEQLSSDFIFGAHIFNFDQLGKDSYNQIYRDLYGKLFNSATIAFYWKQFELEEGHLRFNAEYRDSAEFWNNCPNPMAQPHWRRPATEPVVQFCLEKGIRLHGHTLVWGNNTWQTPDWLINKIPYDLLLKCNLQRSPNGRIDACATAPAMDGMSADEFADACPEFTAEINRLMAKRIVDIAMRYGDKIHSWDVVNESATDFGKGLMIPDKRLCKSHYGPMPGDYTYRGFKVAEAFFPAEAKLNINDYNMSPDYLRQIQDLTARGCKIDIVGSQMHLFNPQQCLDIADGISDVESPTAVYDKFRLLEQCNRPIHLSEITITAPNNDQRGQAIQAVITRNLYRLWFSLKPMMGITWWNVVDNCGAPGEPSVSGIFTRDMQPKPVYHVMDELFNHTWRTNTTAKANGDGVVEFRGFRGKYRLTWVDAANREVTQEVHLS